MGRIIGMNNVDRKVLKKTIWELKKRYNIPCEEINKIIKSI